MLPQVVYHRSDVNLSVSYPFFQSTTPESWIQTRETSFNNVTDDKGYLKYTK